MNIDATVEFPKGNGKRHHCRLSHCPLSPWPRACGGADCGSTQSGRNAFSNGTYCHSAQTCSRSKPRVVAEALHKRSNNPSGGAAAGSRHR